MSIRNLFLCVFVFVILVVPCYADTVSIQNLFCSEETAFSQEIRIIQNASPNKKKDIAAEIIRFFSQWDSQAITADGCDYGSASSASVSIFKYIGPVAIPLLWEELQKNTSNSLWAADCVAGIGSEAIPAVLGGI